MAIEVKPSGLKVSGQEVFDVSESYIAFPDQNEVTYDDGQLLPIGLVSFSLFEPSSTEKVLLALPISGAIFDGDVPFLTYSNTDKGWKVDEQDEEHLGGDFEDYQDYFEKAQRFYQQHKKLTVSLEDNADTVSLFKLGGQPLLGCNWDAYLWDEESDEYDDFFEALEEEEGDEYEDAISREIIYRDDESGKEFMYLGTYSYDTYVDGGGEAIVFYQPELKKVMVISEFS